MRDSTHTPRGGRETEETTYDFLQARALPAFYILDVEYRVRSYWLPADVEKSFVPVKKSSEQMMRLDPAVESVVRAVVADWQDAPPKSGAGLAVVAPAAAVRVMPLIGSVGQQSFLVTIERIKTRNAIDSARRRFSLSPRELDVLALVLEGCDTPAVAVRLHIARSTANDHVKRMLAKTSSRNRAELVARVLGWNGK